MNARKLVRYLVVFICVFSVTFTLQAEDHTYVPPSHPMPIAVVNPLEIEPSIAYDQGRRQYLVAYRTAVGTTSVIKAACVNMEGAVIVSYTLGNGIYPEAVYDPSNDAYIVVWENSLTNSIEANRVEGSCCLDVDCSGVAFSISEDRPGYEASPTIAYNANENHQDFLIVWEENENVPNHWTVWGRRMDGVALKGPSFAISNPADSWNYNPDVAYNLNMNEFMVVFTRDPSKSNDLSKFDIYGIRLWNGPGSKGGIVSGSERAIDNSSEAQDYPRVAAYSINHDTPYLVVYRDKSSDALGDIHGYLVNPQGIPIQQVNIASQPNTEEAYPQISSNEALGGYAVIWDEYWTLGESDVKWRKVAHDGVLGSTGIVLDGPQYSSFSDIANSFPFPFAVWTAYYNMGDTDIFGRFLYQKTFLPSVLRNP